jgi:hypothetical protein
MIMEFSKCSLGKRCDVKTDNNYVFRKFTLLSVLITQLLPKAHFKYGKNIAGLIDVSSKNIILSNEYLDTSL